MKGEESPKMIEAVIRGCEATTSLGMRCAYPRCDCIQIPRAIRAAVAFAVVDAAEDFKKTVRETTTTLREHTERMERLRDPLGLAALWRRWRMP